MLVYDEEQMSPDIERAVSFLEKEGVTKLLSVKDAMGMVTNRSLLILVDHSKTALTLSKDFMIYLPKPSLLTTIDGIRISQIMQLLLISKVVQVVPVSW